MKQTKWLSALWVPLCWALGVWGMAHAAPAPAPEYKIEKTPAWITPIAPDTQTPLTQAQQSEGVSYLLVDRQILVQGSTRQTYYHSALKIQNESGLENSSNVEIRFDPSYQTLHLHAVQIRRGDKIISKLQPSAIKILQREKSLEQLIFNLSLIHI